MAYYRSGTQKPLEAGNGIDIADETISLKQMSTSQFGGAKIDGTSISVNANGQIKKLKTQTVTLSANTSEITAGSTDVITATASAGGTLSVSSSDSSVATASVSNGEVTITGVGEGNCVITVTASATGDYGVGTATIDTTVTAVSIYGAEWDGSSSPAWTRTDGAVGFADPNPYYSGMSGTPSSPFDNIMPWSGMRIVEDANAGTLIEIPKFYYKLNYYNPTNETGLKIQISDKYFEGSSISPAHLDRGDGIGERDYVYIGRYHCAYDNSSTYSYKSKSGLRASYNEDCFDTYCTKIHNLGSYIWLNDYAICMTIWLLYLVEFAHWDSQLKIGYGCGNYQQYGGTDQMGYTDSMPYHTGISATSRSAYKEGTQYRYIEGLWDNILDYVAGAVRGGSNQVYVSLNPSTFNSAIDNKYCIGYLPTVNTSTQQLLTAWKISNSSNMPWVLYPYSVINNSDYTTYICNRYMSTTTDMYNVVLCRGGTNSMRNSREAGMFYLYFSDTGSNYGGKGARLMVLPPSRLSPPEP